VYTVSHKPVHLIGHSMGAMLVQAAAAMGGVQHMIRTGVSIAGCFAMEDSEWHEFMWLWPFVKHFKTLHPELIQEILAPISFRVNSPWDQLFFRSDNVDHNVAREMFHKNWEPVPTSLISQLRSVVENGGLRANDGSKQYSDTLRFIQVPMLLVAGSKDRQCPAANLEIAASCIPNSTYRCFGKDNGHRNDYGHFDLLVGLNAKTEVWDVVSDFLVQNDYVPHRYA
jgi:pimeloyl-ACP methyl ester carboxylesterase